MKIVISGASGLIGQSLTSDLESAGFDVLRLVRAGSTTSDEHAAEWDPGKGQLDAELLSGADAVINLNGRNIGADRWTPTVKESLRSSRLRSTQTLVEAIKSAAPAPRLLINASAAGYYGNRGEDVLKESSGPGQGFLADLCRAWEDTATAAGSETTRVVLLRLGMVVGRGGALAKMLTPFKLGLGGPIGSGSQWWSWVAMEDVISAVRFALNHDDLEGPVNVVSPKAVRCRDFTRTLGHVLRRPSAVPLPAFAARLAVGEMAEHLLLASARVCPAALESHGFSFRVPRLEDAIRQALE
jgi:uncharacterized protein (TIGR01777 family)